MSWVVLSYQGEISSVNVDPVAYCASVRKEMEVIESADDLTAFWERNSVSIEMLKRGVPDLKNAKGEHYGEILEGLFEAQILEFGSRNGNGKRKRKTKAPNGAGDTVDKALLAIATPRRVRDKEHLKYVAQQACMVCGRRPGQAHHLKFAQLRAMSAKPSDEWVVPLCATHHRSLHQVGDEKGWWNQLNLDPLIEAQRLWQVTRIEQGEKRPSNGAPLP